MSQETSREEPQQGTTADRGPILLAVLIGLAVISTVIMLLVDSDGAQRIALLAALWAAIIGFFLLYRDRKKIEAARQELAANEALHRAEMEKAEADQHAEKFRLERQHQEELHLKENETLKEIRQQLEEMRVQLSELSGREWVYEPAVVQAEARRIIELETQQKQLEATEEDNTPEPVAPEHVETVPTPEWTEKTEEPQDVVDVVVEEPASETQDKAEISSVSSVSAISEVSEPAASVEPEDDAEPADSPAPEDDGEEAPRSRRSRHASPDAGGGRRRRDERSGGVSVADLLAAARKKEQQ